MPLAKQSQLGPYRVLSPIGAGGMGEVYRARDDRLERDVALKVLPDGLARSPEALARFQREAKAVAALSHPNILAIYDIGESDGRWYLVSELLEGHTLREEIRNGEGWRRVAQLGASIAEAVAAAHGKGIVHRDLKPENIFLTSEGRVKILDFGLARVGAVRKPPGEQEAIPTSPLVTEPGLVMGTMGYMSPEQVRGEVADAPSDIFSIGCILYEMLTARQPFGRATAAETMAAILRDPPPSLAESSQPLPAELIAIIDRCLEKVPSRRFQSAGDLAFALQSIGTSAAPLRAAKQSAPARWLGVAAIVLLALIIGIVALQRRRPLPAAAATTRNLVTPASGIRLAVLPLEGGPGGESDYLSDEVTESLIGRLSALGGLFVSPRSSVFHYKDRPAAPSEVAARLNVGSVIVGSVLEDQNRVALHLDLYQRGAAMPRWSHDYRGAAGDLQRLEGSAVSDLSVFLKRAPAPAPREATDDPEAYRLYLKGRYSWNKRDKQGLLKAIAYFNQALERDPAFAYAYAGLADSYALLDTFASLPTSETFPKAKAAARKALEIDDSIANAHATLAYVKHYYDRDWVGAEAEYQKALSLDPNYATAHQWYAEFLTAMGRFTEAKNENARAVELDPLSPMVSAISVIDLTFGRDYPTAVSEGKRILAEFPDFGPAHAYLGRAYLQAGNYRAAAAELEATLRIFDLAVIRLWLATTYIKMGEAAKGRAMLSAMERGGGYLNPYYVSYPYIALGETDRALDELQKACDTRVEQLVFLKVDPMLDPLRNTPRFQRLMRETGF